MYILVFVRTDVILLVVIFKLRQCGYVSIIYANWRLHNVNVVMLP